MILNLQPQLLSQTVISRAISRFYFIEDNVKLKVSFRQFKLIRVVAPAARKQSVFCIYLLCRHRFRFLCSL